ncbi:MAG TPA: O-methyltransferase [Candidatus Bathyarchaeia archaeon]
MKQGSIEGLTKADQVLAEIEESAKHEFLPIVGPTKGKILAQAIKDSNSRRILEVGTLIGYSAILIGKNLGKDAEITTIEIHSEEAKMAEINIKRSAILPKVTIKVGDAIKVIPKLKDCYDAVFIDAEKSQYFDYLRLMENKLRKGTLIVADNAGIFADEMQNYLDYVRKSGKYQSKYVSVGQDGMEISVRL